MNDTELNAVLDLIHADLRGSPAPPSLHERVRAIPFTMPHGRGMPPRPDLGTFSMFSALKFVAAAAIVALFGGFLLAGVLTAPQNGEVAPAAVSASPTTEAEPEATAEPTEATAPSEPVVRTDLLPGVALTVEEVQPGIYRVVNDGVRDLMGRPSFVVGHDGGIWVIEDERFYRLGSEHSHGWPDGRLVYGFAVTPDGTVWTLDQKVMERNERTVYRLRSFDGESWTLRKKVTDTGIDLTVAPDGGVWAAWADPGGMKGRPPYGPMVIARFGADGWEPLEQSVEAYWRGLLEGGLMVTEGGDIWVAHSPDVREKAQPDCFGPRLSRYVDGSWQQEGPAIGEMDLRVDIGPAGTIWLLGPGLLEGSVDGEPVAATDFRCALSSDMDPYSVLLQFDGSRWLGWDLDEQIKWAFGHEWTSFIADPHGGLWALSDGPPLAHFDGSSWQLLQTDLDFVAWSEDVTADGSLWILGGDPGDDRRDWTDLYVITPEAMAATG